MRFGQSCLAVFIGLFAAICGAQDGAVTKAISPQFSAEIEAEIRDLSATDFKTREAAGHRLMARQMDAVDPLLYLTEHGSPEASVRAFDLLRQLYRNGDDATNERIEVALEELVHSENPTVASRAEAAVEAGTPIRHLKAIAAFQKLGGRIRFFSEIDTGNTIGETNEGLRRIERAIIDDQWTGGDEGLKYLRRIEDYRIQADIQGGAPLIVVKDSPVSEAAVKELEASLPMLMIQRRGPACFGVSAQTPFGGQSELRVQSVAPGSAADRAGLKSGDLLIKFADQPVPDFDTLVERLRKFKPGDKVPVLYERDGVRDTAIVELRRWE